MAARVGQAISNELAKSDGAASRRALVKAGIAERTIEHRLSVGSLVAFPCGVVGENRPIDAYRQQARAALLGVTGSVLGFQTAAALHDLPVARGSDIHLVVPHGVHHDHPNVHVHQTRRLPSVDITTAEGFATTSTARTLVDLAAATGGPRLRWLCEFAIKEGSVSPTQLGACVSQFSRRRPGLSLAFSTVTQLTELEPVGSSALEDRFRKFWTTLETDQLLVEQFEPPWFDGLRGIVDFAIPGLKIIIEVDGRRWHALTQDMTADRRRDRSAAAEGWIVVRLTWDELIERPDELATDLLAIITDRQHSAA